MNDSDNGQELHADSAYIGKRVKRHMRKHNMKDRVIKKYAKGKIIIKRQETINRKNLKTRVRVEHVFGFYEQSEHGLFSRFIGFSWNAAFNTMTNLVYNMNRY